MLNVERTRHILERVNADWLIVSTPENVFYAAGFRPLGQWLMRSSQIEVLVLIPRAAPSQSILISPAQELDQAAAIPPDVSRVQPVGYITIEPGDPLLWDEPDRRLAKWIFDTPSAPDTYEAVRSLDAIHTGQTVIVDAEWPVPGLQRVLPTGVTVRSAPEVIQQIRVIKTGEEIALLKQGVAIAELALKESVAAVREGLSELDLAHIYDMALVREGGVPFMTLVGFGSNGAYPNHPPTSRRLRRNEMLRWDYGCELNGYQVDLANVGFYGEPGPKVMRYWQAVQRAQAACLDAMRPGGSLEHVYQIGADIMRSTIPNYKRKHIGHGVGIELREPPMVAPVERANERGTYFALENDPAANILEPGMVISLEVVYYELGLGGFQIEDTVVITETGHDRLTHWPPELTVVPF